MKYYTLQEIYNRFGENPEKAIIKTNKPDKFRLIEMIDNWESLYDDGVVKSFCSDANHNIYEPVSDPDGKYQPFTIWRKS